VDFPLTEDLLSQIIFAMEDQSNVFLIDRRKGVLVREDELEAEAQPSDEERTPVQDEQAVEEQALLDGKPPGRRDWEERYRSIPAWSPADGFQLMERFVLKLRNPIFAEMLREALSSGQGVFRRFKDILKKNKEIERLWFQFKEREMRRVVERWYEAGRDLADLQAQALASGEEEDLPASEFSILPGEARHLESALKLDQKAFLEVFAEQDAERAERLYQDSRRSLPPLLDPRSLFLVAETPQRELAGLAWAVEGEDPVTEHPTLSLAQLAVRRHLRGIGLASLLLRRLTRRSQERGFERLVAPLKGSALSLAPLFEGLGFRPRAVELELDLRTWEESEG
jgi:GNAT superfamily N-acetyltransferase